MINWNWGRKDIASFETVFALFVFSGAFKSAPYFEPIPIDLTALLGALAGLAAVYIVLTKQVGWDHTRGKWIVSLYCVFVGYAALTGVWSASTTYFLSKLLRLGTVTAFTIAGTALIISTSRQRLYRFGAATFVIGTITALETFYQFVISGSGVLEVFGTNYIITGRVIGFAVVIGCYYLMLEQAALKRRLIVGTISAFQFAALGLSGARGPLITTIGAIGIVAFASLYLGRIPRSRRAIGLYVTSIVGAIGGSILVAESARTIQRLLILVDGPGYSLGRRFEYWAWTIEALNEGNLLLGYGLGAWPLYVGFPDEQQYPHNIVLEIVMELGIVGLILFTALIGYATMSVIRGWLQSGRFEYIVIVALFAYMLVNTFVSGDLNENRYLFLVIGTMAYSPSQSQLFPNSLLQPIRSTA